MLVALMVLLAGGCWIFALFMASAGGTDIHIGFAAVTAALGAVCLGLAGVISSVDELRKASIKKP